MIELSFRNPKVRVYVYTAIPAALLMILLYLQSKPGSAFAVMAGWQVLFFGWLFLDRRRAGAHRKTDG